LLLNNTSKCAKIYYTLTVNLFKLSGAVQLILLNSDFYLLLQATHFSS